MSLFPHIKSIPIFWKIYFCALYILFVILIIALVWTVITASTDVDSGIPVFAGAIYLLLLAALIVLSALIYKLGARYRYVRPIFVSIILIGVICIIGAFFSNVYSQHKYDTHYKPLTKVESLELIKSCQITSVEVGSPEYSLIRLTMKDGGNRNTERFSEDGYEEELQRALSVANC